MHEININNYLGGFVNCTYHNCYYLGVHSHQDHPFACRNAHLGAVVLLEDLHNKDVGLDQEDLEGLLCYYTSYVAGVP